MADISRRAVRVGAFAGVVLFVIACVALFLLLRRDPAVTPIAEPTVTLAVVGDFGNGSEEELAVAERLRDWVDSNGADALVTTGDNVYPEGDPQYFDRAWDEPYGWVTDSGVELFASLGNHDFDYQGGAAVVDHLEMPGVWYRRSIRDADLFVLDSNRVADPAQTEWLRSAVERSSARWKIAAFHHPPYSCSRHGHTEEVIDNWIPIFEESDVDLVLAGHDHNYQRFETDGGPTFVVTGGGGAALYELTECDEGTPDRTAANDTDHHFVYVEGDATRMRLQVVSSTGDVLDDFELP